MTQPSFPNAQTLPEDVTVTCVPSIASWRAAVQWDSNGYRGESIGMFSAALDKRFRLKIPVGTLIQCDFCCSKPDVYCYTVVLPEHELAGDNGYFGIVLREASHQKIRKVLWKAEVAEREAEVERRRNIMEEPTSSDRLSEVMADLSEKLLEASLDDADVEMPEDRGDSCEE